MVVDYNELERLISNDIKDKQEKLEVLYKTLDEINEYGYYTTFGTNDDEETIKSAFDAGRKIGELEGQIDELRILGAFLYQKSLGN